MVQKEIVFSIFLFALALMPGCVPDEHDPYPVVPAQPTDEVDLTKFKPVVMQGTLVRTSAADPCIVFHNGEYYMTMTGSANIALVHDEDLSKLTTSVHPTNSSAYIYQSKNDPSVTEIFGEGAVINGTWSPEIHYFSEVECPDCPGWYMVFALRMKYEEGGNTSSKYLAPVVLKSASDSPAGPWVHPVTGQVGQTQRFLDMNGKPFPSGAGVSFLRIRTGKYKGLYATWVDSVGRGEGYGNFYQRLRIARLFTPWQVASEASTITTPTQAWEKKGAANISEAHPAGLPMVVEGGTAIYGEHGEIYMTYCGSGYWSDYGQGQLTLKREGGDYADPLETESWIKYAGNPIFSSRTSGDLRGAGHAFFFCDAAGQGLMTYHAYPYIDGVKQSRRNAYVETWTIDYDAVRDTAPQGLLKFGLLGTGVTASVSTSEFNFYKATD